MAEPESAVLPITPPGKLLLGGQQIATDTLCCAAYFVKTDAAKVQQPDYSEGAKLLARLRQDLRHLAWLTLP